MTETARVAFVTGAGGGIGREHVLALAAKGYSVVVNDIGVSLNGSGKDNGPAAQVVQEAEALGAQAVTSGHDISDWSQAGQLIDLAVETYGRLDVLVNNAGIIRDSVLYKLSEKDWNDVVNVHMRGTAATSHFAAAYWRDQAKAGHRVDARLINTTSGSGLFGNFGQTNYAAAKAGIAAMTIVASIELAQYGVTANALAPIARSRMLDSVMESVDIDLDPSHVSKVMAWLAEPSGKEVTGRVFSVMGNRVAIDEGWAHGPTTDLVPGWSSDDLDNVLPGMLTEAKPNANPMGVRGPMQSV